MYNRRGDTSGCESITGGHKMLINFKIKNFKSFKDMQTLSMVSGATRRLSERIQKFDKFGLLKFSAIYGSNAAGKSNLIDGINLMKNIVLSGMPQYVSENAYKLNNETLKGNTYFEVEININKKNYAYGFEVNFYRNKIVNEWLILLEENEKVIFERNLDIINVNLDLFIDENINKIKVYMNDVRNDTNILFLTYLNQNKGGLYFDGENNPYEDTKIFKMIYDWFDKNLNIANPTSVITTGNNLVVKKSLELLINLLKTFDTGIHDIRLEQSDNDEFVRRIPTKFAEDIKGMMIRKQKEISNRNEVSVLFRTNRDFWIITLNTDSNFVFEKLCFYHEGNDKISFSLDEESDGTIRILDLGEALLTEENNKIFVIDELDRCLHPQITCKFVQLFLERATNKNFNNQLIVTTHESRLLNLDVLRRDEVWFVDKKDGESSLYSLEEFNERFDKKIDKAYFDGRYGAIPIFDVIFPVSFGESIDENKDQ